MKELYTICNVLSKGAVSRRVLVIALFSKRALPCPQKYFE